MKRTNIFSVQKLDIRESEIREFIKGAKSLSVELPDSTQIVKVTKQPQNYGGSRYWLNCPVCDRHCYAIFAANGVLACKTCNKLYHPIENLTKSNRALFRANKVSRGIAGVDRPKNMNTKTFKKIKQRELTYLKIGRDRACDQVIRRLKMIEIFLSMGVVPPL